MCGYKILCKRRFNAKLNSFEVHKSLWDSSPSYSTIKKWAAEFKRGRTSLEDDPREGRPISATTPEILNTWFRAS